MPIRGGNPIEEIERMLEHLGRELERVPVGSSSVAVDVEDRDDEFVVTADLPGFEKEDIDVTLAETTLEIEAAREDDGEAADVDYLRRERTGSRVRRSIRLPEPVDGEAVTAAHARGVLTVTLPKRGIDGGEQIEIE